jgi:glutamyl-tRNA(Gln) amidotransferase subunit D
MKKVSILGTGGTIASKIDYTTGAVHPALTTEELFNALPELRDIAEIKTKLLFNILSENMTPGHWRELAEAIVEEINSGVHGIVVAHGTDTLAYTSAALSFMLRNLTVPVILVGSQRSSDRPSSDASENLIAAVRVACTDIAEVAVVMHASTSDGRCLIHRGTRVRKMHSSRRDAFRSINALPIGEVVDGKVKFHEDYRKAKKEKVAVDSRLEERVALVKIHPGINPGVFTTIIEGNKGIVLEGTGLGHVPEYLFPAIKKGITAGKPVVMTTQTLYGRVDMNVYSTGRNLLSMGVIPCGDMLPEVAYVKLMHVMGRTKELDDIRKLMLENQAGEISEKSHINAFLV